MTTGSNLVIMNGMRTVFRWSSIMVPSALLLVALYQSWYNAYTCTSSCRTDGNSSADAGANTSAYPHTNDCTQTLAYV